MKTQLRTPGKTSARRLAHQVPRTFAQIKESLENRKQKLMQDCGAQFGHDFEPDSVCGQSKHDESQDMWIYEMWKCTICGCVVRGIRTAGTGLARMTYPYDPAKTVEDARSLFFSRNSDRHTDRGLHPLDESHGYSRLISVSPGIQISPEWLTPYNRRTAKSAGKK